MSQTLAERAEEVVRLANAATRPNLRRDIEKGEDREIWMVLGQERSNPFAEHDRWYLEAAIKVSGNSLTFDSPKDAERYLGATELGGCTVLAIRAREIGARALRHTQAEIAARRTT